MTLAKPEEFDAVLRRYLVAFTERCFVEFHSPADYVPNFHIDLLCSELEKLRRGEQLRLNVNVGPRSLKSFITSVVYVAWLLGHDPTLNVMCVSYGQDLAESFARQCRQIMTSAWYQRLFPATRLSPARSAVYEFETTAGGKRMATSFGGSVTGFGADYIIIDDGMKPEQTFSETERPRALNWCLTTLFSRLNDKATGRIVNLQQRLHEDDITGAICDPAGWPSLVLPAIATHDETFVIETPFGAYTHHWRAGEPLQPVREGLAVLDKHRRDVGLHEVRMFPGRYKDQVDSTTQAIEAILATPMNAQGWYDLIVERNAERRAKRAGQPDPSSAAGRSIGDGQPTQPSKTPVPPPADLSPKATPGLLPGRPPPPPHLIDPVLVNHPDLGMQFCCADGYRPTRHADGAFWLSRNQYAPLRDTDVYEVEESDEDRAGPDDQVAS
jgi:hypothetical protein